MQQELLQLVFYWTKHVMYRNEVDIAIWNKFLWIHVNRCTILKHTVPGDTPAGITYTVVKCEH